MSKPFEGIKLNLLSQDASSSESIHSDVFARNNGPDMNDEGVIEKSNSFVVEPTSDNTTPVESFPSEGTPIAEKTPDIIGLLASGISPFSPGVTIVVVRQAPLLPHARHAMRNLAVAVSNALGIPMPNVDSVLSVLSGNKRQLEQAEVFAAANPCPTTGVSHGFKTCAALDKLDWTSNEGQPLLLRIIEGAKEGWVIAEQKTSGAVTPTIAQGLIRIGHAAQQACVWVMLFIVYSDRVDVSQLTHACEDLIEVAECEADAGCDTAFSIDCVGIRNLNSLGVGKTMCSVNLIDGVFHRRYAPFISADLETRIMCALRGQHKSLDEIGSIFKINRSTVLRRLQGLPIPRAEDVDQDWLDRNLESLPQKSS